MVSSATSPLPAQADSNDVGPLYPFYLPWFDKSEAFPPIELFDHVDPGSRADPSKPNLLAHATTHDISPYLGTEISGVQISKLTKEGLDELGLYAAERKVLVFRDQDFKDIGPYKQIEIAKHFGPLHVHPVASNVKGYPELLVVYRDFDHRHPSGTSISRTGWHSDSSYEKQPPSTTFFFSLEQPPMSGGDTLYVSLVEAYNRLSPEFQKRLEGLYAMHSARLQADYARSNAKAVRREPVETAHPLVRKHPVTGEKALYVNSLFTKYIVGYKREESEWLLKFLYDHIAKGADYQFRATYEPGTVVVWDNRLTSHSATNDFSVNVRRHAVRLAPQAEIPIPA